MLTHVESSFAAKICSLHWENLDRLGKRDCLRLCFSRFGFPSVVSHAIFPNIRTCVRSPRIGQTTFRSSAVFDIVPFFVTVETSYVRLTTIWTVTCLRRWLAWSMLSGPVVPCLVVVVSSYWFALGISVSAARFAIRLMCGT